MNTEIIPTDRLHPNDWNPNRMGDEESAELVAEVRHLGRLPKPLTVRQDGDGYQIIDGEQSWKAAKEVGLVDEADLVTFDASLEYHPPSLGPAPRRKVANRAVVKEYF